MTIIRANHLSNQPPVNSALHPSAKSSTSFGWGKGGNVTSAGWQVTLCDPIWYVSSRSALASLPASCYTLTLLLLFTLLLSALHRITSQYSPNCTPPNYTFMSFPRTSANHRSSASTGGNTGFLIREPFTQLPSSLPNFSSFKVSSLALNYHSPKYPSSISTAPHLHLHFLNPFPVFFTNSPLSFPRLPPRLTNFSLPATLTYISTIPVTTSPLSLCLFYPRHVDFPTHNKSHILDLVITSSDSSLAPSLTTTLCTPSDHFPIFTKLHSS